MAVAKGAQAENDQAFVDAISAPIFRLPIPSNGRTGLRAPCGLMVDKLTAVPRKRPT
jgi:hypothetical protein